MSYSIIAAIFFATIALSSAQTPIFDQEREVLVRFYSDFAQIYRSATLKSFVDPEQTIEQYRFYFTEREYVRIAEESLTMLYANVIDRTVTFYPMPNFAVNGSRYFYRRDPKSNYTIEIELVNPEERLFREVNQPDRYFYLPSFAHLEYSSQVPVMPYYEVIFLCNTSMSQKQSPLLSYIDRSLQYTPRYLLDLPSSDSGKSMNMCAYADIRNIGEIPMVIKGAELIAGDITLNRLPLDYLRTALGYGSENSELTSFTRRLGEQASGSYVYQLSLPSAITIPARSLKSIRFLETKVTVERFLYYSSVFSSMNSTGKLFTAYNLTSTDSFLPNGRLFLREQGRFLGQTDVPNLSANATFTMIFGADADVSYRRQVTVLPNNENSQSRSYRVEYVFENVKPSRDVQVYFFESFTPYKYFQIENLSAPPNNNNLPNIESQGTDLRGYVFLPRQGNPVMISYKFIVYNNRQTMKV